MRSLIQSDAKIFKKYANECLDALGIPSLFYQIKPGKEYSAQGELGGCYYDPIRTKVIFDQAPNVRTLKKLGWVTETDTQQPLVHCKFDLPGIENGCLFSIKDPLAKSSGRLFRITKMTTSVLYPAMLTCQIVAVMGTDPEETVKPYTGNDSIFLNKEKGEV